jgi:adenylate cyclase
VGNVGSERIMDYTVIGNTPNTARRLQENAQAGQILVDVKTHAAIKGAFRTREIEPMELKGHSHPIQIYEVLVDGELTDKTDANRNYEIPLTLGEYHEDDVQIGPLSRMRA